LFERIAEQTEERLRKLWNQPDGGLRYQTPEPERQVEGLLKYVAHRDRSSGRGRLFGPQGRVSDEERRAIRDRDWRRMMLWIMGALCILWTVVIAMHLVH